MELKISASLMCANLMSLSEDIDILYQNDVEYIHYDIMDGTFVPNITLGFDLFNLIREKYPNIKMDIHFLTEHPECYLDSLNLKKDDIVTIHVESSTNILSLSRYLHSKNVKLGLAINVTSPVEILIPYLSCIDVVVVMMILPGFSGAPLADNAIHRLKTISNIVKEFRNIEIEVDGHVCEDTIPLMKECGANIFVGGSSSIFKKNIPLRENIINMRAQLK